MMVHRTRKRLTKTELKRDPVAENLEKAWNFCREHLKALSITLVVVAVGIVAIQAAVRTSHRQNEDAMARYLMADMLYEQAEQVAMSGQPQQASQLLGQSYTLATQTWEQNQNRIWGRRACVLSAKAGILLGRYDEVITRLQQLMSSRPQQQIEVSARLHMAVALENRAGSEDLLNARDNYTALLADSADFPLIAAEAMGGLARLSLAESDIPSARAWLERSLAMKADTTDFEEYMLARMDWAEGQPE